MGWKETIKNFFGWIVGGVLVVFAGIAYFFGTRRQNSDSRRVQRGDEIISGIESGIEASKKTNRTARARAGKAGEHISSAIESIDNAQSIMERARKRSTE